jgi:hypothetical protein
VREGVRVGVRVAVREAARVGLASTLLVDGMMVEGVLVSVGVGVLLGSCQKEPGTSPGALALLYMPG